MFETVILIALVYLAAVGWRTTTALRVIEVVAWLVLSGWCIYQAMLQNQGPAYGTGFFFGEILMLAGLVFGSRWLARKLPA